MKRFTDAVRRAVAAENWYAALSMALLLPDVCGRLEDPSATPKVRYIGWVQKWFEPKYTSLVGAARERHVFLCAEDCYALRCSYLHEGGGNILEQKARKALHDFHFITPPKFGVVHMNQVNSTLQLQADIFARDMAESVDEWMQSVKDRQDIQERMQALLVVHDSSGGVVF